MVTDARIATGRFEAIAVGPGRARLRCVMGDVRDVGHLVDVVGDESDWFEFGRRYRVRCPIALRADHGELVTFEAED